MKVETKFNIGDTVWYKKLDKKTYIFTPREDKIDAITIHVKNNSDIEIIYFLELLPFQIFHDRYLYATKEACQKACIGLVGWLENK